MKSAMIVRARPCSRRRQFGLAVLMLSCLGAMGCGGEPSGQLSGRVTNHGQPVSDTEIQLESTTNPDNLFRGSTTADGVYRIDYRAMEGLPPGPYQVTIRHYTLPGGKPLPQGEEAEGFDYIADGKAVATTFVFEQEVVEGSNEVDFELTKGKKSGR